MNTLKNGMTHFSKATPVRMLLLFFVSLVSLAMLWILDNEVEFMVFLFLGVALFFVSTAVNLADARTRTEADNIHSQSEMEFGLTAIKSHCIVSFTDTNDRIVEVNQKLLDAFEYALEDVIGQSPQILHDGIGDESVFNKIHSNLTRGRVWVGEHSAVTKSGKRKFFQATVIPLMDARGKYVKSISLRTDVTRLRTVEVDRQMRALLDKLQDEVYIYRVSDLTITYVNQRACERCEWDPQNYSGKRITDTDPHFDESLFRAHVAPIIGGQRQSVVIQAKQLKGPVEISTSIDKAADGEPVFVSVLRDLRGRKAIERAKMSSVSVVSHELRTPLTSISGSLRMLQGKFQPQLAGPASSLVDLAVRNCDRLMLIVNDILDLEKIESGEVAFNKKPLDLARFVSDAIEINKGYGDELGVRFELDATVPDAIVDADAERLMQAMSNLLSNAAKYSNADDVVTVSVSDRGQAWRIAVTDTGPGIPEDVRHLLFNSFAQLTPVDGKKRPGTGLGLAITKTIVEKNGGKCGLESTVGSGSKFYFDLPKPEELQWQQTNAVEKVV